jgi:hypothetical protein
MFKRIPNRTRVRRKNRGCVKMRFTFLRFEGSQKREVDKKAIAADLILCKCRLMAH